MGRWIGWIWILMGFELHGIYLDISGTVELMNLLEDYTLVN